jgi:hypothetical protein
MNNLNNHSIHFYCIFIFWYSKTEVSIIVVYLTSFVCKLAVFGMSGPKKPNLHKNELNTTFFCSTSPLKSPNRLKSLKLS